MKFTRHINIFENIFDEVLEEKHLPIEPSTLKKGGKVEKVTIVDICDKNIRFLSQHSKSRLQVLLQEPKFILNSIDSEKI